MCGVAWCNFSWEAFATLFTGIIAVAGVVWVSSRQSKIMQTQIELERLKLKAELFDRRLAVYVTTVEWFNEFFREGRTPNPTSTRALVEAERRAKFLFRPLVSEKMDEWYKLGVDHETHRAMEEHAQAGDVLKRLFREHASLNDVFGPDMNLKTD